MFLNINIKAINYFFTFIEVVKTRYLILIKQLTKTKTYLYVIFIKILDNKGFT